MPTEINQFLKRAVRDSLNKLGYDVQRSAHDQRELEGAYIAGGRRPWSLGYDQAKQRFVQKTLTNPELLKAFALGSQLPSGYGVGFDERCIEYPWLIANLRPEPGRLLDAGSALNHEYILNQPLIQMSKVHILTLFPEQVSYWNKGISYLYEDLRDIPIRDNYYDAIACISVLEHIGLDNSIYTRNLVYQEDLTEDFIGTLKEMHRVLKPDGELFFTVPFGEYEHLGFQQQFDARLLAQAIESFPGSHVVRQTYYKYASGGWQQSEANECAHCQYVAWVANAWRSNAWPDSIPVEPDLAAAARAVACVRLRKR